MYIRLKIFERKETNKENKPLYLFEVNGTHAIKLLILMLVRQFYNMKKEEIVKQILEKE